MSPWSKPAHPVAKLVPKSGCELWDGWGTMHAGLLGQTVVVIGGDGDIAPAVARCAKAAGARLILTDTDAGWLEDIADDIGVEATAIFDAGDVEQAETFLADLPTAVDHVIVAIPVDGPTQMAVARFAAGELRVSASLVLVASDIPVAAMRRLAEEIAPIRTNVIVVDAVQRFALDRIGELAVRLMADSGLTGRRYQIGEPGPDS